MSSIGLLTAHYAQKSSSTNATPTTVSSQKIETGKANDEIKETKKQNKTTTPIDMTIKGGNGNDTIKNKKIDEQIKAYQPRFA